MQVKWCKLKNFRNYDETFVEFFSGTNLISGGNGQGKTNLVEAVMLNALSKSPRTSHDEDLKKEGETHAEAEICVARKFGDVKIKCIIDDQFGKKFFVNSNELKKVSELFGNLVAVYFSPNDLVVVSGSPAERRDFMDTDISELSGSYYNLVQRYGRVLFQRNKLLKTIHDKLAIEDQIEIWNEQLATLAGLIIKTRKNFIEKLKVPANEAIKYISKDSDTLSIFYDGAKGETAEEIKDEILKSLRFNLSKDMELGYTTIGPHRDDVIFELCGKDSKIFASQGQQRSIVLALKIAELMVFEKELGEKPVLVLDDVFSELDSTRQKKLYALLDGYQVLMTGTNFKFKPSESYLGIQVKKAQIKTKLIEKLS
jgi:DNA replication and repair protein RecF